MSPSVLWVAGAEMGSAALIVMPSPDTTVSYESPGMQLSAGGESGVDIFPLLATRKTEKRTSDGEDGRREFINQKERIQPDQGLRRGSLEPGEGHAILFISLPPRLEMLNFYLNCQGREMDGLQGGCPWYWIYLR